MSSSSIPTLVPPIPATADLAKALDLFSDPTFKDRVAEYLTSVETARESLNDRIETFGKIQSLDRAYEQVAASQLEADTILARARAEAKEILDRAEEEVAKEKEQIKTEKENLSNRRRTLTRDEASVREDLKNREEALTLREENVKAREKEASDTLAKATSTQARLDTRISELASVGIQV